MAEKLRCNICGYVTVRCGMANHIRAKHPDKTVWYFHVQSLGQETKEEKLARKAKRK